MYQTEQEYAGLPQHPAGHCCSASHQPCGERWVFFAPWNRLVGNTWLSYFSLPLLFPCEFILHISIFSTWILKQFLLPRQLPSMFPFSLSHRVAVHTTSHTFAIFFSLWGWASARQLYYSSATSWHLFCWAGGHQLILQNISSCWSAMCSLCTTHCIEKILINYNGA